MTTNDVTFGENSATFIQDSIGGFSISKNKMVVVLDKRLCLSTYVSGAWTQPAIPFTPTSQYGYVAQPCITMDGMNVIAAEFRGPVTSYTWNSSTSTYTNPVNIPQDVQRDWMGLACTPDGKTLVVCERYGYVYFTKWNMTTNNYDGWTQILMTSDIGSLGFCGGPIAITDDGSKIIYGGGGNEGGPIYYSMWDSVANNYGESQLISSDVRNYQSFSITRDGHLFIAGGGDLLDTGNIADSGDCKYALFNSDTNTFGPLLRTGNYIYVYGQTWISYEHSILYYMSFSGIMQIPIISATPPPLYLGNDIIITGSNVEFNNATVSVKVPMSGPNVSNKAYVDANLNTSLNTLIDAKIAERIAEDDILIGLIAELQARKANLTAQMNNIYQYFFNTNGNEPPSRT